MQIDPSRFRVLSAASEEVPIWELPFEIRTHDTEGRIHIEPALSLEDVRGALIASLRAGDVVLYELQDREQRLLPTDEALRAAADDTYWDVDRAPRRLCLLITDQGDQRLAEVPAPSTQ
jgi:hypothetical protein